MKKKIVLESAFTGKYLLYVIVCSGNILVKHYYRMVNIVQIDNGQINAHEAPSELIAIQKDAQMSLIIAN